MRLHPGLICLAACSFDHGLPLPGGGGGGNPVPDPLGPDAQVMVDAAVQSDAPTGDGPCADADNDGVCNTVDDWPCGAKPTEPPTTVTWTQNSNQTRVTVNNVNLDNTVRYAVALSQDTVNLKLNFDIDDTSCMQSCIDQLEIGWVSGSRLGCVFDDIVPDPGGVARSINVNLTAPNTKGVYDLRVNLGQNYSCTYQGANSWWGSTPGTTRTIAKLCVH